MTPDGGHSLNAVYRGSDKKLLRYTDDENKPIAIMAQGRLVVTSHGMTKGYYVAPKKGTPGVLMHEGGEAWVGKPFVEKFGR